jgi:ABC-type nitrate/sulfonate/bicarbonate transport system substrate-binding protein
MGTEVAVQRGVGKVVLDIRRGDGPPAAFDFTMASVAASDDLISRSPETVAAAVRAIVSTHSRLKQDVSLAADVGKHLFPTEEASLIVPLIERDLPYYDATISPQFVERMNAFARTTGILIGNPTYEEVVATQFAPLWTA